MTEERFEILPTGLVRIPEEPKQEPIKTYKTWTEALFERNAIGETDGDFEVLRKRPNGTVLVRLEDGSTVWLSPNSKWN